MKLKGKVALIPADEDVRELVVELVSLKPYFNPLT